MNKARIAILTDSGTDVPAQFSAQHDIRIIPLTINYHEGSYRADVDISCEEICRRFDEEIPTTSLPTPETIRQAFEQARADGYKAAAFITLASGLSATHQTVRLIADAFEDFPIAVIDSKSIGVAAGLIVMRAARYAENGCSLAELQSHLEKLSDNTSVFFCCGELSYLRKGGRISEPTYRLGSILNIKPIITCDRETGRYVTCKKPRGWNSALETLATLIAHKAKNFPRVTVAICCSVVTQEFERLEALLAERVPNIAELIRSELSSALIVHTGPKIVGMAVQPS